MRIRGRTISNDNREILQAARTYYVATTGNDSNTGLTAGSPFLTLQKAANVYQSLDCNGFDVTISVADGTYTAGIKVSSRIGKGDLYITGNSGTPANVLINTSAAGDYPVWVHGHPFGSTVILDGVKLQTTQGISLFCDGAGFVQYKNVTFHSTGAFHLYSETLGKIQCTGSCTVSANAAAHLCIIRQGTYQADSAATWTMSGTPAFSTAFCYMLGGSYLLINSSVTMSGSATGKRYDVQSNSVCDTQGSGANFFPGNSAGTTATGGQYI